jgi:hypothetical protein
MTDDRIALLKEEYFHLQKTVDDFDQRTLNIKAWSVTTSMAGIATSFLHDKSLSSVCFHLSLHCRFGHTMTSRDLRDFAEPSERDREI